MNVVIWKRVYVLDGKDIFRGYCHDYVHVIQLSYYLESTDPKRDIRCLS